MGACMAIGPPAALIGKGQKLNAVVAVNGQLRIIELSVKLGCQGRLAKPGADALGDLVCSYAVVILTDGAVRKSNVNHYLISFSDVFNNKNALEQEVQGRQVIPRFHPDCRIKFGRSKAIRHFCRAKAHK